ncbi:shikimate dehydrogenase [Candidatus Daviesbacteria bacterium]|nr:shikimate dehydrogenase [Candidatus Daviesbacteria bacterium]
MSDSELTKICMSIGYPIKSSKSPSLHTVGYKALGIEDRYVYLRAEVKPENLKMAVDGIRGLGIRGVSVTMPHKQEVMKYLDKIDDTAKKIGAVNTIVNESGKLIGYNTDWIGAVDALKQKTKIKGKKIAVIGAGGAARAIVFGIIKEGGRVKIFNRTKEKAEEIAKSFGCEFGNLDEISEIKDFDIIINSTSIGMGNPDESPVDKKLIGKNQIVFDVVYNPKETKLLRHAKEKGAEIIFGADMLLYQGAEQFKLYTGLDAPIEAMKKFMEIGK